MLKVVINRLLSTIPLLLVVSVIAFTLLQLLPGDPVLIRLGEQATQQQYDVLESEMGLDRPIYEQYFNWVADALHGDFGQSLVNGQSVSEAVTTRFPVTLTLTIGSVLIALFVGITAGVIGGGDTGSRNDRMVSFAATIGLALPNFWAALLLVKLFSLTLGWFPATGYTTFADSPTGWLRSVTLPCIALGSSAAAAIARQTRSSLAGVLQQGYVTTAVSKGATATRIVRRHALKNAFIPVVTVLGFQFTTLLGGALVVERVFALPGLGSLAIRSVVESDVTMVQGIIMYTTIIVVAVNLLMDLTYAWLNPKVRPE